MDKALKTRAFEICGQSIHSDIEGCEDFQLFLGNRLDQIGFIQGDVINMDGHSIKLFSRKEMKTSYLSKDKA